MKTKVNISLAPPVRLPPKKETPGQRKERIAARKERLFREKLDMLAEPEIQALGIIIDDEFEGESSDLPDLPPGITRSPKGKYIVRDGGRYIGSFGSLEKAIEKLNG